MKKKYFRNITILFLAGILLIFNSLFFTSCDRTRNDKGYEYFPDMGHTLAYKTYSPNPNFKDGKTEQPPVPGTVNRDMLPYHYPANDSGRVNAGRYLFNPLKNSKENINHGKEKFIIFCQNCHGEKGDGNGYLFTSKLFTVRPASLFSEKMMKVPEGEIFHIITRGWGVMGAHGAQIKPEDRWRIVIYIQNVIQKKHQ